MDDNKIIERLLKFLMIKGIIQKYDIPAIMKMSDKDFDNYIKIYYGKKGDI